MSVLDQAAADVALGAATKQHPVGHHGGHDAARPQHRHHVLHEHQISLLATLRAEAVGEALLERQLVLGVVL
jgi:hypothetical protein